MQRAVLIFLSILIALMSTNACRKKANVSPIPAKYAGCRVSRITQVSIDKTVHTYNFYYNDDGAISKINAVIPGSFTGDNYVIKFIYKNGCILSNKYFDGENFPAYMDSLALDERDKITYIFHNSSSSNNNGLWDNYQYDSLGEMVFYYYKRYNGIGSENYQWKNGDLEWNSSGKFVYYYNYDTGVYNIGNINASLSDLIAYGRGIYIPIHLVSQAIRPAVQDTINTTYILDSSGKITFIKEVETGNFVQTTQITYSCE